MTATKNIRENKSYHIWSIIEQNNQRKALSIMLDYNKCLLTGFFFLSIDYFPSTTSSISFFLGGVGTQFKSSASQLLLQLHSAQKSHMNHPFQAIRCLHKYPIVLPRKKPVLSCHSKRKLKMQMED